MRLCRLLILMVGLGLTACSPPRASDGGFNSPNPAARLYAIRDAGLEADRQRIPELIEALASDDPAARLLAIGALERITGTRLGYEPYALPADRAKAIERWKARFRESPHAPNPEPNA